MAPLWTRFLDDDDDRDEDHDRDDDDGHGHDGDRDDEGPDHREPDWFTASVAVGPPPGVPAWGAAFVAVFLLSALCIAAVAVENLSEAGPTETRETVRAFNLMRARLDRCVHDRTAMLAAVSHDLRTPIARLRLHAEFVEDMQREETRTVDLHVLVDSVAADLAEFGHDIAVDDPGRMLAACRPAALRRGLRNLLENAAVHGGRATVRIEREDEEVRVVIEDEGPGIPEAARERM